MLTTQAEQSVTGRSAMRFCISVQSPFTRACGSTRTFCREIKRRAQHLVLLWLAGALTSVALSGVKPQAIEVNGVAATVNGRVITRNQVRVLVAPELLELTKRFPDHGAGFDRAVHDASEKMLAILIEREKTIQGAKALGVQVGEQQVDARIAREIDDHHGGNRNDFESFLRSRRTTMKLFRRYMRDELLEDEILRRQGRKK